MEGLAACYESLVDKFGKLIEATKSSNCSSSLFGDKSLTMFHSEESPTSNIDDAIKHKSKNSVARRCTHPLLPRCRNPSFGLATKAKGVARVRA
jgi:hypothetical protein